MAEPRERPDRSQRKTMVIFLDPSVARQVKTFAAQNDTTVQRIGEEAIQQWLAANDQGGNVVTGTFVKPPKSKTKSGEKAG